MKCEDSYFNLGIAFHLDKQTPGGALQKMKLFMKTMTKRWTNENGQNVFGGDNAQLSVFRIVFIEVDEIVELLLTTKSDQIVNICKF